MSPNSKSGNLLIGVLALALMLSLSVDSNSAELDKSKKKLAINDLSKVDDDFVVQGEYRSVDPPFGLQVVALGDGQFQAVQYYGGLPGGGWDGISKESLSGKGDGRTAHLVGENSQVEIADLDAELSTLSGVKIAKLFKVHRQSPTMGHQPPNVIVIYDGHGTVALKDAKVDEHGLLEVGTELVPKFKDFQMHVEFRLPYMPYARGQDRSNSGIYLQSRYEVQVLDSFGLEGKFNECGALYRYRPPVVNMCLPPLVWQTYDITFCSPRFDGHGEKTKNGCITVLHNGIPIHQGFQIERKTGAGKPESPKLLPIKLQDHSNPVKFRNIWVRDLSI